MVDFFKERLTIFFNSIDPKGAKLITRLLWLGLNRLQDHKFKHSFQDSLNPICSCSIEVETAAHFLLHRPNYLHDRKTLLENIIYFSPNISEQHYFFINNVLLFGDISLDGSSNIIILNEITNYMTSAKTLDDSIFMF